MSLCLLLLLPLAASAVDHKEHKVHNIVLYPERHAWCQTTPIRQVVSMPGYAPLTIDNHVCVGACYSYSIPRTHPAEPGELIGPYCDSCQPKTTRCYHVTLRRANVTSTTPQTQDEEPQMRKRVQVIADCGCSSCDRAATEEDACDLDDGDTSELPANLVAASSQERADGSAQETPELMAMQPSPGSGVGALRSAEIGEPSRTYHLDDHLRRRLLTLVQSDGDERNSHEALVDMRHLADVIRGASGQLTDRDVIDFVNWINEHEYGDDSASELDAVKLKTALDAFDRRELRQKHRRFGLGSADAPIEGGHLGVGLLDENVIPSGEEEEVDDDATHAKRRVGDAIGAHGNVAHLVMGPHGALVLGEERLSISSDEMAPNREGTVIDYRHHRHRAPSPP